MIAIAHAQEPTSTEEKTYRLIEAYRLAHNHEHTQYKKLASCYYDLYSFYDDDGGTWNMQALHDHLEDLIRQGGKDKLHHIVQSATQPQTKQNRSAALVKWLRLWGAKNKWYMLSAIADSNGKMVVEKGECARLLQSHWKPVFTRQSIDAQSAATFLRKYRANAEPADLDWIVNFDDFDRIIPSRSHSAPGPDGISYVLWVASPKRIRETLYNLYVHLLQGGALPDGFNHAYLIFLAKCVGENDSTELTRDPASTRLLSLSNTDAKINC